MSVYDAQSQNTSDRNARKNRDLDLFFGKKSSDSDINVIEDGIIVRSFGNCLILNNTEGIIPKDNVVDCS